MRIRAFVLAFAIASAAALSGPQSAGAQTAAPKPSAPKSVFENRAILVRGSEPVKGLPNFGQNALQAVYGEYRFESASAKAASAPGSAAGPEPAAAVRVWMTQEALYLAPSDWKAARYSGRPAHAGAADQWRLYLFDRPFAAEGQGASPRLWSVIVAVPASGPEAPAERFVPAFLDKLSYFLSNARAASDASFPAVVEF